MEKVSKIIVMIVFILSVTNASSQIGINTDSPISSSVLDINAYNNDKGLLIPRMTTAQKQAIASPASGLLVYDTDYKCISQYKDTPSNPGAFAWTCLTLYNRHFFYKPSVNVPTATSAGVLLTGTQTINLYNIYNTGFRTPKVKSTSAPASIPFFGVEQLNYYVTYSDPCITVIGISDAGVLSYKVNSLPNYDSYINVVFTVK